MQELAKAGYRNIELSGGTQPYPELEQDLLSLQRKYSLNYVCHNYFPPPEKPFVVNLASLDEETYELSLAHIERSLDLSRLLGVDFFGFHAGFLINIPVQEIGKSIQQQELFESGRAMNRFAGTLAVLTAKHPDLRLFVENNVLASMNYRNFGERNPFFVTTSEEMRQLQERQPFNLLLDVAHLKVTCATLNLDFEAELTQAFSYSNYIHISDNDGTADSNGVYSQDSELFKLLKTFDFKGKYITLETYGGLEVVAESYQTALLHA